MTLNDLVFEGTDDFEVTGIENSSGKVMINVRSRQAGSFCPGCGSKGVSVHCYYTRQLMDLLMFDNISWIRLRVRKFYCTNPGCKRKVFTESFERLFGSRKQITESVHEKLLKVALLMGGYGGQRLCSAMRMPVCSATLIRAIHRQPLRQAPVPRVLGIDDWAFKKRLSYGTVLVDMEQRKIIDLLPDREAKTVEQWLKTHPGVEIVSRDRYSNYANGVLGASGEIVQVADRWHLLKNMGEIVKKVLVRNQQRLKQARQAEILEKQGLHQAEEAAIRAERARSKPGILRQKFIEMKQLLREGHSVRKIGLKLKMHRCTIKRWRSLSEIPKRVVQVKSNIQAYESTVRDLLVQDPEMEIKEIWKKIRSIGYNGKQTAAYEQIGRIKGKKQREFMPKLPSVF